MDTPNARTLPLLIALLAAATAFSPLAFAASEPQLEAEITQANLSGWNCNPSGGPASYQVRALIGNPYRGTMSVNYSYYDFPSQSMVNGSRACVIPPQTTQYCDLYLQVRLGSAGNSTAPVALELRGNFIDQDLGTRFKRFNLTVIHTSNSYESEVDAMITSAERSAGAAASAYSSECSEWVCCGMPAPSRAIHEASTLLSSARASAAKCDLSNAVSLAGQAGAKISDASRDFDAALPECRYSLELFGFARANASAANLSIRQKPACQNYPPATGALENASRQVAYASSRISEGAFATANTFSRSAIAFASSSLNASTRCPRPATPAPAVIATPSAIPSPTATPQGFNLSGSVSAYALIGLLFIAIIIAAIYLANRIRGRREPARPAKEPAPRTGKPQPRLDADSERIDREFREWLEQEESEEEPQAKRKPAKAGKRSRR